MVSIYHICSMEAWEKAKKKNYYWADSLEKDGFIHCSKYEQVLRVANTFFHGQMNLVLLEIDPELILSEILWEPGFDKPDELFPHIYGRINLGAIKKAWVVSEGPDYKFHLPPQ